MRRYFYTEKVTFFESLQGTDMDHDASSQWLNTTTTKSNTGYSSLSLNKLIVRSIQNGKLAINIKTTNGYMTIRSLWKEASWNEYCELQKQLTKQGLDKTGDFEHWLSPKGLISYHYRAVSEAEKNELINTYFMDFFSD